MLSVGRPVKGQEVEVTMKTICVARICCRLVICLVALLAWAGKSWSADLPQSVSDGLQRHDSISQQTTFVWQLSEETQHTAMRPDELASNQKQLEKSYAAIYRRTGVTDEAQIRKLVQQNISLFTKAVGQSTISYSNSWRFVRDHQRLLISGAVQHTSRSTYAYRQFYDGSAALLVEDDDQTAGPHARSMSAPVIWRTSGESICNFAPVVQGLNVLPEHLAMLTGLNPLAMHGAQWKLVSTTPDTWTLKAQVEHADTPVDVQIILDRKHDNIPAEIQMITGKASETFTAQGFRQYQGGWICDKALYKKDVPGVVSATQQWVLQSLEPSKLISVNLPQRLQVHDYRLMGPDLNWQDIQNADTPNSKHLVYYSWPGQFPNLDELRQMYQKQHPGEASPDPGKTSSSLPFVGGLLCLVGGVWMFKRRGMS